MVLAGRMSRKNSPWAFPISCQRLMSVVKVASAHHVLEPRARLGQGGLDVLQGLHGLRVGIARAHEVSIPVQGRGAGHVDVGTHAHGAGVADDRLPRGAARYVLPFVSHRMPLSDLVDSGTPLAKDKLQNAVTLNIKVQCFSSGNLKQGTPQ